MRLHLIVGLLCTGAALAGIAMIVACDTESASENNVRVTPANVRLAKGQSQQFTASGGYEYTWSLDGGTIVDEWGRLSASRGPTTVYTSTKDASTSGTFRVIRLVSTIPGSGTSSASGTNVPSTTTSYSMTALGYVEHAVAYSSLNVTPAAVSGVKYGNFQAFTATGGNGVYTWNLENDFIGEISTTESPSTTYSSKSRAMDDNTMNRLRCLSGDGQAINIPIFHANEAVTNPVTSLAITPSTATVSLNGAQTFTASGGDGSYVFDLSSTAYGELTFSSQNTATYLCTAVDPSNTVTVTLDVRSNGETRQATILHTPNSADQLSLSIRSATLALGQSASFTAVGGESPYVWDYTPQTHGTLTVSLSGNSASYTSDVAVPTNAPVYVYVTVTSSDGQSVDAVITHRN